MTTLGFDSTTDDVLAGADLQGRRFLVTGASTGLGLETTRALSAHGASVTMAVRDLTKGEQAAVRSTGGVYLEDCHVAAITEDPASRTGVRAYALDPASADALWALSEELTR